VGKKEHSPADMRRTKVRSRKLRSGDVEAHSRQIVRDFGFPFRVSRRLFHDKPFCAGVEPDAEHVGPQAIPGSPSMDCSTNARALAGRAPDDEIARNAFKSPLGKELSAPPVDFDKLDGSEAARCFEAERMAADVAEKVKHTHLSSPNI
jgi:hypothetical protein